MPLERSFGGLLSHITRLCCRLNIPIPGRGYWRKLQTGKRVPKRPALPASSRSAATDIVARMSTEPPRPAPQDVLVAPTLDVGTLHPITALALVQLRAAKPERKSDIVALGFRVLPDNIDRAILIADALVKEFGQKG